MFSATQSITPLRDFSESFSKSAIKRPQTIEAKPACWSQNLLAKLNNERMAEIIQRYYECQGFTLKEITQNSEQINYIFHKTNDTIQCLRIALSKNQGTVDIANVRNFCNENLSSANTKSVFITRGSFSSGALDFCAHKPITLISNREMLSLILNLDTTEQKKLLAQATA